MCGITGFFALSPSYSEENLQTLTKVMTDAIRHRGPDDSGVWVDPTRGIALGFRRLAILDLSPSGHQPMLSPEGRFVIVFNGEIYNYANLREELRSLGHTFLGTSDTEVMLASIREWGLGKAVQQFNGMFAFALWDRQECTLSLVRDRLGIKPLYYGWAGRTLLFGSELKALRAYPEFHPEINRDALTLYLRHNYIPAPHTIYTQVYKLPPASILTVSLAQQPGDVRPVSYWSAREVMQNGLAHPFNGTEQEAVHELERVLLNSVRLRMIADVPLGAFLSGGVDSSTIVALMQKQSTIPVRTFTIGFHETGFDEAHHARTVAKHLGTDHTELYVTSEEAQAVIPRLPALYDEPFSDSSQIPTFLVAELARQHVTVSLSGDGGDELFGGYNRYFWTTRIWKKMGWIPAPFRKFAAHGLAAFPPGFWNKAIGWTGYPNPGDKIHKLAEILGARTPSSIYLSLVSHWKHPEQVVLGGKEPTTAITDLSLWLKKCSLPEQMMALDLITYLPDDILTKVDRASMGISLETRVPFLDDHKVVEFAWKLPLSMKIRAGQGKWILRQVLNNYVPQRLIERPKMGFGVPIDAWLRGPLRDWAETLLDDGRIRREGFFHPEPIRQKWTEHMNGTRNWQYYLWDILMFQSWLEINP
jgi:asparagine synthase (glutamine-hydrolysing)